MSPSTLEALHPTGDEFASPVRDRGLLLQPPAEAVRSYRRPMASGAPGHSGLSPMSPFGVTPELAQTEWPVPTPRTAIGFAGLLQLGFSESAASTFGVWKGQSATLHSPTADAHRASWWSVFARVETGLPGGLFGTQCPIFLADGRVQEPAVMRESPLNTDQA